MNARDQLGSLVETLKAFEPLLPTVEKTGTVIGEALRAGHKLLTCGNGGSAADAIHLSAELVGRFDQNRPAAASICLCSDAALLTSIANDFGYEAVFSRQLEGLGKAGDVFAAFSTSGNSQNLVNGLLTAKRLQITTISILGKTGGKCSGMADYEIVVPSDITARVQEVHTFILHVWMTIIERDLWSK